MPALPYELAALLTALCWSLASLLAADVSRELGGVAFNRVRNTVVFAVLMVVVSLMGVWHTIQHNDIWLIFLSGVIGIALGDSALFATMRRLGPRLTHMFYATNAPIAVVLGVIFLGERLSHAAVAGVVLVFTGVLVAIAWGRRADQRHRWETTLGMFRVGVALGLLAGLGQAVGAILIKPVLVNGADPVAVVALRIGAAVLVLWLQYGWQRAKQVSQVVVTVRHIGLSALNGLVAIGIGMSLLMYAFAHGDVGIASVLSATVPVLVLPVLWLATGERPAWGAWVGASLVVVGTAVILSR